MFVLQRTLNAIGKPLEVNDSYQSVDAIVVLGAPCLPDRGLSQVQKERVDFAIELFEKDISNLIIISGGSNRHRQSEAAVMGEYALAKGTHLDHLLLEETSTTTRENARFTAELMKSKGLHSAWLATQPFHLKRAVSNFKEFGIEAYASTNQDSMQYKNTRLSVKWMCREYAAWAAEILKIKS